MYSSIFNLSGRFPLRRAGEVLLLPFKRRKGGPWGLMTLKPGGQEPGLVHGAGGLISLHV